MKRTLDVPLLRADTLGVASDAVMSHLARKTAIGGYEAAAEAEGRIADVYDAVAALAERGVTSTSTSFVLTAMII